MQVNQKNYKMLLYEIYYNKASEGIEIHNTAMTFEIINPYFRFEQAGWC